MNHFIEMLKIILICITICYVQCQRCPPGPPGPVLSITSPTEPSNTTYLGFGPIHITCQGTGDPRTTVYYIRENGDGNLETIPVPKQDFFGKWVATLNDDPPPDFPYTYSCLASHPCHPNVTAPGHTVYKDGDSDAGSDGGSIACISGDWRLIPFTITNVTDISADVDWQYHVKPGDTGFRLSWYKIILFRLEINLDSTATNYTISGLVPNSTYKVNLEVLYGDNCSSLPSFHTFKTRAEVCPFDFPESSKAIHTNVSQTSAVISWQHTPRPQDNGFIVSWNVGGKYTRIDLNSTATQYKITGLVPYTDYAYLWQVRSGFTCTTLTNNNHFTTLTDVPGLPRDVRANTVNSTAIIVTWEPPEFPNGPNLYYRIFYKEETHIQDQIINVPIGLFQLISNLDEEEYYQIQIMAINSHGNGGKTEQIQAIIIETTTTLFTETPIITETPTEGKRTDDIASTGSIIAVVVPVLALILIILVILYCLRRRKMKRLHQESIQSFREMHGVSHQVDDFPSFPGNGNHPLPVTPVTMEKSYDNEAEISYIVLLDDWEIMRDDLKVLGKKLGGGQFGIVKQGIYSKGKKDEDDEVVAVKMLKDGASSGDRSDLLTELKILKEVNKEPHPNVLRLVGACSAAEPILVVMEFCPGGNLRKFLLNSRVDEPDDDTSTYVNLSSTLSHRQLLKISADVASGMIHLASFKFVHRDLAARNVLIGEDDTAKLADFGLARDISQDEEYVRANQNLLPVKWMALESLLHGRFSTASDIWSYGVLLFEITTLGDEPYKGMSPYNIVSHVGSGCRMQKPKHCSEKVYLIMKSCWQVDPNERPSFENIYKEISSMLSDEENTYINVKQVIDEGPLRASAHNLSIKDGSVRYTTA